MLATLRLTFPGLGDSAVETSPATPRYNFIAWAANDQARFWWPSPPPLAYWPPGAPRRATIEAFVRAFEHLGYRPGPLDETLEVGIEKVAFFADPNGTPTHGARQLPDGFWTSKMGKLEDIRH